MKRRRKGGYSSLEWAGITQALYSDCVTSPELAERVRLVVDRGETGPGGDRLAMVIGYGLKMHPVTTLKMLTAIPRVWASPRKVMSAFLPNVAKHRPVVALGRRVVAGDDPSELRALPWPAEGHYLIMSERRLPEQEAGALPALVVVRSRCDARCRVLSRAAATSGFQGFRDALIRRDASPSQRPSQRPRLDSPQSTAAAALLSSDRAGALTSRTVK